jgi:hypothetical protein
MTVAGDSSSRGSSHGNNVALEDRFEVLKEIGDGSFGSVVLARVRTAGASVARRGTVVSNFGLAPGDFQNQYVLTHAGCDQVHEENIRLVLAMPRASGSCLLADAAGEPASRPSA